MLSLWPALFDFALVAPVLLRLVLGGIFVFASLKEINQPQTTPLSVTRLISVFHFLVGGLLIIGLWTQPVALLISLNLLVYLTKRLVRRPATMSAINKPLGYLCLMLAVSLSLLFLGPGFWAFDLPL